MTTHGQSRYLGFRSLLQHPVLHLFSFLHLHLHIISTMSIKVGDTIPEGTFKYVPYTPELDNGVSRISLNSRNLRLISYISSSPVVSVSDRE